MRIAASRILVLACIAVLLVPAGASGQAAREPSTFRPIPGCGAVVCEDEHMLTLALDAILASVSDCSTGTPRVLNLLYLKPATGTPVPGSPIMARASDYSVALFTRYWDEIELVDTNWVLSASRPATQCFLAFSIPVHRAPNSMRVEVALWTQNFSHFEQKFVLLHHDGTRWRVQMVQTGRQS
jgi:hypothetical protein